MRKFCAKQGCESSKIAYERAIFKLSKEASPQHTMAYVRSSTTEEQLKKSRSEQFLQNFCIFAL